MPKTIVITGAGSGLGKHLAQRFAADGENVVLLGRTLSKLESVAKDLGDRAMAVACDVGSADAVRAAFEGIAERHPKIDVLINNAMLTEIGTLATRTAKQIEDVLNTNLVGAMLCIHAALPMMDRGAHIISVSSESLETPFPRHVAYQASKAGLERMSHFLQKELDPRGIRVTVVRAGEMVEKTGGWEYPPGFSLPPDVAEFFQASKDAGIDLEKRPKSDYASCTGIFRAIIDQPPDVQITTVHFIARQAD
jgi:NAD(P)-dependent dehydrogenase (short-subunit alcohol dehydrogenase family)